MADTHETIADIIAEMRFHGQLNIDAEQDKPEFGVLTEEGRITKSYADRLEAAHKRERGDCAKLREALEKVRDSFYVNDYGDYQMEYGDKVSDLVDAALAAPARNCDSYDGADEMMEKYADDAFLEEWKKWRETGKCHPLMLDAFLCISWLYLTNGKGETNGSK